MSGELTDPATELLDQGLGESGVIEVNDVLNHIVAKGVLHKASGVLRDLTNQPHLLVSRGMVNAALQNAATMAMSADIDTSVADCREDELSTLGVELV